MNEWKAVLRRSWQSHFWSNLATTTVLTLSFSLIIGAILFSKNLGRVMKIWGEEIQLVVYLKDDTSPEQQLRLLEVLNKESSVEDVKYIGKERALKSIEKSLSHYGPQFLASIAGPGENPFPASLQVRFKTGFKTPETIEGLAKKYATAPGVEDVSYGQEWLTNYKSFTRVVNFLGGLIVGVLLIGCVFTISHSIQASLFSRREEVEILELVGATAQSIRTPFLIEGAFQGLLAATVAFLVLGVFYKVALSSMESWLGSDSVTAALSFLPWPLIALFVLLGAALGAGGSYICVGRINTGWAAAQQVNSK